LTRSLLMIFSLQASEVELSTNDSPPISIATTQTYQLKMLCSQSSFMPSSYYETSSLAAVGKDGPCKNQRNQKKSISGERLWWMS
jgi:hypothetical protein